MTGTGDAPEGFREVALPGGFFSSFGALYARLVDGVPILGFLVKDQHINPLGVCHGGVIASLADMQALGAQQLAGITDRYTPTINLTVDYIAPTKLGAWVQMRTALLGVTRSLLFSQGLITADDVPVARTSGVFKIGSSAHPERKGAQPLFR
jgi:uncharacterized protein (TIGR00369 family)